MSGIDFDKSEEQEALRNLYTALQLHQKFWSGWLADRTGQTANFFAPDKDEQVAVKALGEALLKIADLSA